MVCIGRRAQVFASHEHGHPGREPFFPAPAAQSGVDQGGEYFPTQYGALRTSSSQLGSFA